MLSETSHKRIGGTSHFHRHEKFPPPLLVAGGWRKPCGEFELEVDDGRVLWVDDDDDDGCTVWLS